MKWRLKIVEYKRISKQHYKNEPNSFFGYTIITCMIRKLATVAFYVDKDSVASQQVTITFVVYCMASLSRWQYPMIIHLTVSKIRVKSWVISIFNYCNI